MPGDTTNVILENIDSRMARFDSRVDGLEDAMKSLYRLEAKMDQMINHLPEDRAEQKALEARVLRCETQILSLKTEFLTHLAELEKKFLRWAFAAAVASGGAGAGTLKLLSLFGAQ